MPALDVAIEPQAVVRASLEMPVAAVGELAVASPQCKIAPEVLVLEVSVAWPIVGRLEVVSTW